MYTDIRSSLSHHKGALELVYVYLRSEYQYLQYGGFDEIARLEDRLNRIVRDAFKSRTELRRLLGGRTVREYAEEQEECLARPLLDLVSDIESFQERCRMQAGLNKALTRVLDEEHRDCIGAMCGIPVQDAGQVRYQ